MPTTVIIVRHGESTGNVRKICSGFRDVALSPLGIRQAECTANFLRNYPIEAIYSSPLKRARQTAEPNSRIHGCKIQTDSRLKERFCGEWEGVKWETIKAKYADEYKVWEEDIGHSLPSGGEPCPDLLKRASECLSDIVRKNTGKCVLITTHAFLSRVLFNALLGFDLGHLCLVPFLTNAAFAVAEFNDDGTFSHFPVSCYDAHLRDLTPEPPQKQ